MRLPLNFNETALRIELRCFQARVSWALLHSTKQEYAAELTRIPLATAQLSVSRRNAADSGVVPGSGLWTVSSFTCRYLCRYYINIIIILLLLLIKQENSERFRRHTFSGGFDSCFRLPRWLKRLIFETGVGNENNRTRCKRVRIKLVRFGFAQGPTHR